MMGIYIKGMEIPKDCIVCPFGWNGCNKQHDFVYMGSRPDNCPLVPVPPHGIIDREQILDAIRLELAQANAVNDMDDYDEWMRIFDYIRKFPTIIPAEEGE